MALACRFCHEQAELEHDQRASYAVTLTHGSTANLMRCVKEIEGENVPIPSCCVHCEECGRYSLISYSSRVFVYSKCKVDQPELKGFSDHYQQLCLLYERFQATKRQPALAAAQEGSPSGLNRPAGLPGTTYADALASV